MFKQVTIKKNIEFKNAAILFLLIFLCQSLICQNIRKSTPVILDLEKALSRQEEVPLSRFVKSVVFIPLETNPQSIIGINPLVEVTDEYIIIRTYTTPRKMFLFDRRTGKFIKEIGKAGRGPNEYLRFGFIPYDSQKNVVYAVNSLRQLVAYNVKNDDVEIIRTPDYIGTDGTVQLNKQEMSFDMIIDDEIFVGYFINIFGLEKNLLALFTKDQVIKIFPNYQALNTMSYGIGGLMNDNHIIYKHNNKYYYLELFSDTLFQLTKNSLIPRYYFKMGKYNVTWQTNATMDHLLALNYFYMMSVDESYKYLFIKILFRGTRYLGYIDKMNNAVTFCKFNDAGISGFKDDVSGLMDIGSVNITPNNEIVYVIQPSKMIQWLKSNPEKEAQVKNRFSWIKNIDEFSNPVIAICTSK